MKAFTNAFAPATMLAERVNALVEEVDAAVLLVGPGGMVLQTHSWAKFGRTRSRPNFIMGSLIGMVPRASTIIIYHGATIASLTVTILAATEIANCRTIEELVALAGGGPVERHGTAWHSMARHGTARHSTARHGTASARHDTTRHGTARHGTTQHDMK